MLWELSFTHPAPVKISTSSVWYQFYFQIFEAWAWRWISPMCVFWKCYDACVCRWWQRGALGFDILGSQMRGSWETSPRKGSAVLVLSLELLCAKSVATSWCHTLSKAFLKCGFFSFTGCTSVWMRGWESWALKSTPQNSSKWTETWAKPLTHSSHFE